MHGKAAVWKCFKVGHEGSATAICNVCKTGISHGGKKKCSYGVVSIIKLQAAYSRLSVHMGLWHSYDV